MALSRNRLSPAQASMTRSISSGPKKSGTDVKLPACKAGHRIFAPRPAPSGRDQEAQKCARRKPRSTSRTPNHTAGARSRTKARTA